MRIQPFVDRASASRVKALPVANCAQAHEKSTQISGLRFAYYFGDLAHNQIG